MSFFGLFGCFKGKSSQDEKKRTIKDRPINANEKQGNSEGKNGKNFRVMPHQTQDDEYNDHSGSDQKKMSLCARCGRPIGPNTLSESMQTEKGGLNQQKHKQQALDQLSGNKQPEGAASSYSINDEGGKNTR